MVNPGALTLRARCVAAVASPAGVEADVKSALINLGYDERTAEAAVKEVKSHAGSGTFEKLLRASLTAVSAPKR